MLRPIVEGVLEFQISSQNSILWMKHKLDLKTGINMEQRL